MALQKRTIPIRLGSLGLDTKQDPRALVSAMIDLQNGEFSAFGAINKRKGFDALSTDTTDAGTVSAGAGLATFDSQLLAFDGTDAYTYSANLQQWKNLGTCRSIDIKRHPVIGGNELSIVAGVGEPDFAYSTGSDLICVAYPRVTSSAGSLLNSIEASIFDATTGAPVLYRQTLYSDASANLDMVRALYISDSDKFCVVWSDSTSGELYIRTISAASPTAWDSEVAVVANMHANDLWDACVLSSTEIAVAYKTVTSTYITCASINASGTVTNSGTISETPSASRLTPIRVFATTTTPHFHVTYTNGTGIRVAAQSAAMAQVFAPITASAGTAFSDAVAYEADTDELDWYYYRAASSSLFHARIYNNAGTGTIRSSGVITYSMRPMGWPITVGGRNYLPLSWQTAQATKTQGFGAIYDLDAGSFVGGFAVDEAFSVLASAGVLVKSAKASRSAKVVADGSTTYAFAYLVDSDAIDGTWATTNVEYVKIDFSNANKFRTAQLPGTLLIAGGLTQSYDGCSLSEFGFMQMPEISASASASGGSLPDGVYGFKAVYSWTDSRGREWESTVSAAATATVSGGGGSGKVTITYTNLFATNKDITQVVLKIYVTEVDGTIYYLGGILPLKTSAATSTVDITNEATTSYPQPYTAGGTVDKSYPGESRDVAVAGTRFFMVRPDARVFFSQEEGAGVATEFSQSLSISPHSHLGEPVAIDELDGRPVILFDDGIEMIEGPGPNAAGVGGSFSRRMISTDGGAISGSPTCRTDAGLWFVSDLGPVMLTRGLQVDAAIGAPAEAFKSLTITGITNDDSTRQTRFVSSDGDMVIHDSLLNKWSTFLGSSNELRGVGSVIWQSKHTIISSAGVVRQQSSDFTDTSAAITMLLETEWIKVADLQGYQRIYWVSLLGQYKSAHTINVLVWYDYEEGSATETITAASSAFYTTNKEYQFRFKPARQRCQAIKFRIYDSSQSGTGESLVVNGLQLEIGTKGGINRQSPSRTF